MSTLYPLQALDARRSVPSRQLGEPAPDTTTLRRILQSAVRVPDHGKLVPFRFLRITGTAREVLGEFLVKRTLERDPQAAQSVLEKERERFCHAPLVITVVARLQPAHQIPEQEQLLTAGCVCFALLQAAQAYGFGAQWLTGWMAYDCAVAEYLNLNPHEHIIGFIHIGTPCIEVPERERPNVDALLQNWTP
ncbi:MAG TPA: nitroreductase family protein [Xylella sp.]